MGTEQDQIQLEKYKECLMYVNNDLGMLLQNAENLAYKVGAIKPKHFHYQKYDFYDQYEKKDILTLRKNIISSLNFLKKQFIAIKQETGKEYIFPPSIELIKNDVQNWKKKIEIINPDDTKYYNAILSMLEKKKYNDIPGSNEIYKLCNKNKESDANPYMWIFMSPPILHNIDSGIEQSQLECQNNQNVRPDVKRDVQKKINDDLIKSNEFYIKTKEINTLLKEYKDIEKILTKIYEFKDKFKIDPAIETENLNLYNAIMNNMR